MSVSSSIHKITSLGTTLGMMRLINTETYLFEEFIGRDIPAYAILSHTWGEEEVSFKDMADPFRNKKKGFRKISMSCLIASQANISYVWVDTCCIDKSSSAELTEAINSMFRWYERASKCLAFLDDLSASAPLETAMPNCRWFKRGWTLQELIAPDEVDFYDHDWNYRVSKRGFIEDLSRITGINQSVLRHSVSLSSIAVAQKMSWAAYRETTRIEDTAYSLLGIFNVNMPLLYGEEGHAFRRLQDEIIKSTPDFSIFAWRIPNKPSAIGESKPRLVCGVLAEEPLAFAGCESIRRESTYERREFSISNIGVKSRIRLFPEHVPGKPGGRSILPLDCSWFPGRILGIRLRKYGNDQWVREDPWDLVEDTESLSGIQSASKERFLLTELPETNLHTNSRLLDMSAFLAQTRSRVLQIRLQAGMYARDTWPYSRFDNEDHLFFASENSKTESGVVRLGIYDSLGSQNATNIDVDCIFYAVHWAFLDASRLQCTLVDYRLFIGSSSEVQSRSIEWDYDSDHVLEALVMSKIPKCSSFPIKIPGTRHYVSVSFTTTLITDPSICRREFWRVNFYYKIYKARSLPEIQQEKWSPPTFPF